MLLVQAWRRQLLGGLGAALIVPATLLVALVLLAFAGGFAGLGELGQAFAGPSLTTAGQSGGPAPAHKISTAVLLALAAPRAGLAGSSGAAPTGGGRRTARAAPHPRAQPQPGGGGGPTSLSPAPTPPGPSPAPPPRPTLTDELIGPATSATSRLPAPVGPAATGALQAAGSTVDRVVPLPAPGPPSLP
jgi:hypothetical protein